MNRKTYASFLALTLLAIIFLTGCSSSSGPPVIAITGGTTTPTATVTTTYGALTATVTANGSPVGGSVAVTFTAPTTGATGTFANGTNTETDMTVNGVATSSAFTANGTPGSFNVAASTLPMAAVNIGLTNTGGVYSFYLSGTEPVLDDGPNFYALAGSIVIDANGNAVANGNIANNTTVAGEQDFNDAFGFLSPEPSGDLIAPNVAGSPALVVNANGLGYLTLTSANANGLFANGNATETLGVQFVNANHALIIEFDGAATSSGSMDLQTLPNTVSGGYAFTLSGVDANDYDSIVLGGVFTVASGTMTGGVYDQNDAAFVTLATPFPLASAVAPVSPGVVFSTPDAFGRGTITGTNFLDNGDFPYAAALNYYIVGAEAMRLIDVDPFNQDSGFGDSGVGSAYGQGTTVFNNASLGAAACATVANPTQMCSVFGAGSNLEGFPYAAVAQIAAIPDANVTTGTFTGVGDDDEAGFPCIDSVTLVPPCTIADGTYSVSSAAGQNGYASLAIANGDLLDVSALGIYMTDPALNLNDPNNTSGGGGALVAEMDVLVGTGVLTPQTDPTVADFTGNYALGWQDFQFGCFCEYDFIGQGSVTGGVLSGTGYMNDPSSFFGGGNQQYADVTFMGNVVPDSSNLGRYTSQPGFNVGGIARNPPNIFIYQASAGQLFMMNEDPYEVFLGPMEQQGTLPPFAGAVKKATPKAKLKQK
jgi:hypothetical protein